MPLDGAMLSQVKQEIETAVGARVDRITQPGREELIVALRGRQGAYRLLISVNAASPRVHFTRAADNQITVPSHDLHAESQGHMVAQLVNGIKIQLQNAVQSCLTHLSQLG